MASLDAIVVAGGGGSRLGGTDKAAIIVGGRTLLDRTLVALAAADRVIVVGPDRRLPSSVVQTSEQPPGGGPAAAVVAGLCEVKSPWVVVLACDMPFVTADHVQRLIGAVETDETGPDGATYVDAGGRQQLLTAVYRAESLRRSAHAIGAVRGASMRALTKGLTLIGLEADSGMSLDCDTWDDVARSRELLEEA